MGSETRLGSAGGHGLSSTRCSGSCCGVCWAARGGAGWVFFLPLGCVSPEEPECECVLAR